MPLEGGEDDAALGRFVAVLDEKARHVPQRGASRPFAHRDETLIPHPYPGQNLGYAGAGLVMAQPADQLVGRAAELGVIDSALAELERKRFGALELVGEPGIGKTRLLAELSARADGEGHLVLSGSASELERELPFWVFVDALDEYLEALEPRRRGALDDELLADLAPIFPSLADGEEPAMGDQRYRVHRGVRQLLEALAATKPLVLLLDDVHWADPGSAELLGSGSSRSRRRSTCRA